MEQASFAAELRPVRFDLFEKPKVGLKLPESIASIEEAWQAPGSDRPLVYLIQDAHTNESGQINLAKTLDLLLREVGRGKRQEEKLKYVFVEAGVGNDSLSFLRKYSSLQKRKQVASEYLKKGILHGEEYLDLTSDHDFVIWGVEDIPLYQKAIEAYRAVVKDREKFQAYLSKIQTTLTTLKPRIFNPGLLSFDQKHTQYLKEETPLTDYFQILTQEANKRSVSLLGYPYLSALNQLKEKESQIDFKKADEEQLKAIQSLPAEDRQELLEYAKKESPFKLGSQDRREDKAFYVLLQEKLDPRPKTIDDSKQKIDRYGLSPMVHGSAYPELSKYFAYLKEAKTLNPKKILEEQKQLEGQLFGVLAKSSDEQTLLHCQKNLRSLQNLFDLKLTPEEYTDYKEDSQRFTIYHLTGFLNKKIMDLQGLYERALFLEEGYEKIIQNSETFYELTKDRDEAFVKNMLAKWNESGRGPAALGRAVLITGGFHTTNLKALLKQKNISFVSITPQVYQETNQKRYESLLLNQKISEAPITPGMPMQHLARLAAVMNSSYGPAVVDRLSSGAESPSQVDQRESTKDKKPFGILLAGSLGSKGKKMEPVKDPGLTTPIGGSAVVAGNPETAQDRLLSAVQQMFRMLPRFPLLRSPLRFQEPYGRDGGDVQRRPDQKDLQPKRTPDEGSDNHRRKNHGRGIASQFVKIFASFLTQIHPDRNSNISFQPQQAGARLASAPESSAPKAQEVKKQDFFDDPFPSVDVSDIPLNSIMITGSTGFLGSELARSLAIQGTQPVVSPVINRERLALDRLWNVIRDPQVPRNTFRFAEVGDALDLMSWTDEKPKPKDLEEIFSHSAIIYHLAAQTSARPLNGQTYHQWAVNTLVANVLLTKLLSAVARQTGKPMVYGSSLHAFALNSIFENPIKDEITEETPIPWRPQTQVFINALNQKADEYIRAYMAGEVTLPPNQFIENWLNEFSIPALDGSQFNLFEMLRAYQELEVLKKQGKPEVAQRKLEELEKKYPLDLMFGFYALSKIIPEANVMGLPAGKGAVLRFSNIYGPGMRPDAPKIFLDKISSGQGVTVSDHTRYFVSWQDVVVALEKAGEYLQTSSVHPDNLLVHVVPDGEPVSMGGLYQILLNQANDLTGGLPSSIKPKTIQDSPPLQIPPISTVRLEKLLGRKPASLSEGLRNFAIETLRPPTLAERLTFEQHGDPKTVREVHAGFHDVVTSGWYSQKFHVQKLEREMARRFGVKHAVAVGSGTEALMVVLMALGIGQGDEVIVPTLSYIATVNAIVALGAKPVFVDIEPETYQIDTRQIEASITPKTKAIMPVYIYGQSADIDELEKIAEKHHLKLIGDMAQASGATYEGKSVAVYGNAAILSLDPTKTVYAIGKGGIVFTDKDSLAESARSIRSHGSNAPNLHKLVGLNATMQEIPAMTAVLNLKNMDAWIQRRQEIAALYKKFLGDVAQVSLPKVGENRNHTYWQYVIRVPQDKRSALFEFLKRRKIENWQGFGPGIFYPLPMHAQKSMLDLGMGSPLGTGKFPVAEEYTQQFISLPIFPQMTDAQVRYVAKAVRDFFATDGARLASEVLPQRVFIYSWGGPVVKNLVETILKSKHQVVGVVAVDAGWNKDFLQFLKDNSIPVILLPAGFDKPGINRRIANDPEMEKSLTAIAGQIRQWNADVGMVMQFSQVPDIWLDLAKKMTVNFHPSDLPNYRGARPRHMQLFDKRTEFTVTWHEVTSALDQGDIVKQIHGIPIYPENDRAIDLYNRFIEPAATAAIELLDDFGRGSAVIVPQQGKPSRTSWKKDVQPLRKLDFSELSGDEIDRRVRIFYNFFPEVWAQVGEVPFVPDSAELVPAQEEWLHFPAGTLLRYESNFAWWRISDGVVKVGVRFQDDIFRVIQGEWKGQDLSSYKVLLEQAMKDHIAPRSRDAARLALDIVQDLGEVRTWTWGVIPTMKKLLQARQINGVAPVSLSEFNEVDSLPNISGEIYPMTAQIGEGADASFGSSDLLVIPDGRGRRLAWGMMVTRAKEIALMPIAAWMMSSMYKGRKYHLLVTSVVAKEGAETKEVRSLVIVYLKKGESFSRAGARFAKNSNLLTPPIPTEKPISKWLKAANFVLPWLPVPRSWKADWFVKLNMIPIKADYDKAKAVAQSYRQSILEAAEGLPVSEKPIDQIEEIVRRQDRSMMPLLRKLGLPSGDRHDDMPMRRAALQAVGKLSAEEDHRETMVYLIWSARFPDHPYIQSEAIKILGELATPTDQDVVDNLQYISRTNEKDAQTVSTAAKALDAIRARGARLATGRGDFWTDSPRPVDKPAAISDGLAGIKAEKSAGLERRQSFLEFFKVFFGGEWLKILFGGESRNNSLNGRNLPSEIGNLPSEIGNLPSEIGNLPSEIGNLPSEIGNLPRKGGDSNFDNGNISLNSLKTFLDLRKAGNLFLHIRQTFTKMTKFAEKFFEKNIGSKIRIWILEIGHGPKLPNDNSVVNEKSSAPAPAARLAPATTSLRKEEIGKRGEEIQDPSLTSSLYPPPLNSAARLAVIGPEQNGQFVANNRPVVVFAEDDPLMLRMWRLTLSEMNENDRYQFVLTKTLEDALRAVNISKEAGVLALVVSDGTFPFGNEPEKYEYAGTQLVEYARGLNVPVNSAEDILNEMHTKLAAGPLSSNDLDNLIIHRGLDVYIDEDHPAKDLRHVATLAVDHGSKNGQKIANALIELHWIARGHKTHYALTPQAIQKMTSETETLLTGENLDALDALFVNIRDGKLTIDETPGNATVPLFERRQEGNALRVFVGDILVREIADMKVRQAELAALDNPNLEAQGVQAAIRVANKVWNSIVPEDIRYQDLSGAGKIDFRRELKSLQNQGASSQEIKVLLSGLLQSIQNQPGRFAFVNLDALDEVDDKLRSTAQDIFSEREGSPEKGQILMGEPEEGTAVMELHFFDGKGSVDLELFKNHTVLNAFGFEKGALPNNPITVRLMLLGADFTHRQIQKYGYLPKEGDSDYQNLIDQLSQDPFFKILSRFTSGRFTPKQAYDVLRGTEKDPDIIGLIAVKSLMRDLNDRLAAARLALQAEFAA